MNDKPQITRRQFVKSSAFTVGWLALARQGIVPALEGARGLAGKLPWYKSGAVKTTYNYCDICPWRCGIVVKSVNGRVVKIDGNPLDPKSRGMLCARGQGGVSFNYDPDRLKQPMIRTGARGEGKFKNSSW